MRTRSLASILVLSLLLLVSGCGGSGTGSGPSGPGGAGTGVVSGTPPAAMAVPGSSEATTPFESAAAIVVPVVVNVGIEQRIPNSPHGSGALPVGNGSGIVISSDGYILTNNHVVEGSDAITAVIASETVAAKIVGRDPSTDLAVIKVPRTGLATATIGDPQSLRVGEWVIAVGTPFGLAKTVTAGIVSFMGRSAIDPGTGQGQTASSTVAAYTDLIQTDASINPGNSGGALARLDGSVVGVNTLIESASGSSSGVGFAIPIDFAMSIARQLIKNGKAVHPFLGVGIVSLDPFTSQQLGVEATQGVLVQQVLPNGGAEKAGIRKGDIIVAVAGEPVNAAEDLSATLRSHKVGDTVPVVVLRGGKRQTLQVTIGSDATK